MTASTRRATRPDAAFHAAIAPLLAEQDATALLVARAMDSGLGALLAGLVQEHTDGFPARVLRRGEDIELAALVDAERSRRRRAGGGAR